VTREELLKLQAGDLLWDKDYGLVELMELNGYGALQVKVDGETYLTWDSDVSLPTSLMKELG
jgi:hypothetical protein